MRLDGFNYRYESFPLIEAYVTINLLPCDIRAILSQKPPRLRSKLIPVCYVRHIRSDCAGAYTAGKRAILMNAGFRLFRLFRDIPGYPKPCLLNHSTLCIVTYRL